MTKPLLATVLTMLLFGLAGCETYRHIPSQSPASTTGASLLVSFREGKINGAESDVNTMKSRGHQAASRVNTSIRRFVSELTAPHDEPSDLYLNVTFDEVDTSYGAESLLSFFSMFMIPARETTLYKTSVSVTRDKQRIFSNGAVEKMKRYSGFLLPLPFLFSTKGLEEFNALASHTMEVHKEALARRANQDRVALEQNFLGKSREEQRQWIQDNRNNLLRSAALKHYAGRAPAGEVIAWHRRNMDQFNNYKKYLPEEEAVWFSGPRQATPADLRAQLRSGESPEIMIARIESGGGPYPDFSDAQIDTLRAGGLPEELIIAMIRAKGPELTSNGGRGPAAREVRNKRPDLANLVLDNTRGKYMNPWTSDGVLADWVDKAINAKMGSAAGSAAGAAAGAAVANQALDNVPGGALLGGILGSKAGEAVGREAAIDEAYIRRTSDQSFRTLDHMARYLKATYSRTRHYQDAIKAANEIYPGLMDAIRQQ